MGADARLEGEPDRGSADAARNFRRDGLFPLLAAEG